MQIKKRRGTLKGGDTQEKKKREEEDWRRKGIEIERQEKRKRESPLTEKEKSTYRYVFFYAFTHIPSILGFTVHSFQVKGKN